LREKTDLSVFLFFRGAATFNLRPGKMHFVGGETLDLGVCSAHSLSSAGEISQPGTGIFTPFYLNGN
jgi:hypothetical protein